MRRSTLLVPFLAFTLAPTATAQLSVTRHVLSGTWFFQDQDETHSGDFTEDSPNPYSVSIDSDLTEELFPGFVQEASLTQRYATEVIDGGFRTTGLSLATNPTTPFYRHNLFLGSAVRFTLSEPTQLRVSGFLRHDPLVDTDRGTVVLLNGTDFVVSGSDEFVGAFSTFEGTVEFDIIADFDAGNHQLGLVNYSTQAGNDGSGLIGVDTAWDITVQVIPSPATIAPLAMLGVVATRRRR
ncbi:MAG: hypothetical protein F6K11_18825 [Leptolyngbya sp. SIO3F4]|nr:hypothetical protein [Leptolyngbya sp. SIO3F4]